MDGILALTFFASPPTVLTFFFTVTVAFSTFLACEPLLKTRSVTALYTSLFLTSFHTKVGNRYSSILKRCIHIIYIAFHRCYIFRYLIYFIFLFCFLMMLFLFILYIFYFLHIL